MRLTARGWGLLATAALLLAAGFAFGYGELAVLGSAAVVAVFGALVFVAWRPRLAINRRADPDRVHRGSAAEVQLEVTNTGRVFGANLVARDSVRPAAQQVGSSRVPVPLVRLRPGRTTRVSYPVPTRRRGLIEVGPLEISRRDPLGLVAVLRRYGDAVTVWVRPRVYELVAVPVGLSRSMDGRVDRVPHGSITFSALREYVVGDDLRHVHWRTSARAGELMVRENMDTSMPWLVVLLDDRRSAHGPGANDEPTFEAACDAAASLIVAAARDEIRVELRLVSGADATARRGTDAGALLDLLAEASLRSVELRPAVEDLRGRRLGDTLIFLTGPSAEQDLDVVAGLGRAYPSIITGVFGPADPGSGIDSAAGHAHGAPSAERSMLVVTCVDGADFAAAWDGSRAW